MKNVHVATVSQLDFIQKQQGNSLFHFGLQGLDNLVT